MELNEKFAQIQYSIGVRVEVPETPTNRDIGVILMTLKLCGEGGLVSKKISRTVLLQYKSLPRRIISTIFWFPLMLFGFLEEKQTIFIEFDSSFYDNPYKATRFVFVELQSRQLQWYSMELRLHANFKGLRYFLYHWPFTASFLFFSVVASMLGGISSLFWIHKWTRFALLSVAARFENKSTPKKIHEEIPKSNAMKFTEETKNRILKDVETLGGIKNDEETKGGKKTDEETKNRISKFDEGTEGNFSAVRQRTKIKAGELL